jgi:S-adenosylhomocysteine hydrolase
MFDLRKDKLNSLCVFEGIAKVFASLSLCRMNLERLLFVCVQHELAATVVMFKHLIAFGVRPKNIYVIGKHYSTCEDVVNELRMLGIQRPYYPKQENIGEFAKYFKLNIKKMWDTVLREKDPSIDGIIVLDDGSRCISGVPPHIYTAYNLIGIEQTTAGLINSSIRNFPFPVVEVASSAAKLWLESPIIGSAAITNKIEKMLRVDNDKSLLCGIVGLGYVGEAVTDKLISLGYEVIGYDKDNNKKIERIGFKQYAACEDVIKRAKYIFGCTGYDITKNFDMDAVVESDKIFLSCSSEDKEFLTLLRKLRKSQGFKYQDALSDFNYKTQKGINVKIIRGGFPITFDGSGTPAPLNDIQLTQGLLLAALIQAIIFLRKYEIPKKHTRIMLDPSIQKFVAKTWIAAKPSEKYPENLLDNFTDWQWIFNNSGGNYFKMSQLDAMFGKA